MAKHSDEYLETAYEASLRAFSTEGTVVGGVPQFRLVAEDAGITEFLAKRLWSEGVPALGLDPIRLFFENASDIAGAQVLAMPTQERLDRLRGLVRMHAAGVAVNEVLISASASRIAISNLMAAQGLQREGAELAEILIGALGVLKSQLRESDAPEGEITRVLALLERLQKYNLSAVQLAKEAFEIERMRAAFKVYTSTPAGNRPVEHSRAVIEDAHRLLEESKIKPSLEEMRKHGKLPDGM